MHFDIIHEITCGCNCLSILIVLVEKGPRLLAELLYFWGYPVFDEVCWLHNVLFLLVEATNQSFIPEPQHAGGREG
jgi:hypothetical protein